MNIELIAIGKTKAPYIVKGIEDYLNRIRKYVSFSLIELPDVKNAGRLPEEEQKKLEGKAILSRVSPSDYLVLLDERGREFSSMEFSSHLETIFANGKKKLLLIVGGPYGFSEDVYVRADEKISLSRLTFNHEMVRLFLTEQFYRALTIMRNEPYHHK